MIEHTIHMLSCHTMLLRLVLAASTCRGCTLMCNGAGARVLGVVLERRVLHQLGTVSLRGLPAIS